MLLWDYAVRKWESSYVLLTGTQNILLVSPIEWSREADNINYVESSRNKCFVILLLRNDLLLLFKETNC